MEGNTDVVDFSVTFRGKKTDLSLPFSQTLEELSNLLEKSTGASPHTQKLIPPRAKLKEKGLPPPKAFHPTDDAHRNLTLADIGIVQGAAVLLLAATEEDLRAVTPPGGEERLIGFAEEDARARRRRRARAAHDDPAKRLPKTPYTFEAFQTLSLPGIELTPPAAKALRLMHRLASDPGIVAIMAKHRWTVGIMTEMAPEGYVGISPKCLLGFNKNHGEEISLRLRTDDLLGFRKYDTIRKTLLHELAHMVHSEHDENFHALDKQLNDEVAALDWTRGQSYTLGGAPRSRSDEDDASGASGSSDDDDGEATGVMAETRRSSGLRLGGGSVIHRAADPRLSAARAALQRISPPNIAPPPATPAPLGPTSAVLPGVSTSLRHIDITDVAANGRGEGVWTPEPRDEFKVEDALTLADRGVEDMAVDVSVNLEASRGVGDPGVAPPDVQVPGESRGDRAGVEESSPARGFIGGGSSGEAEAVSDPRGLSESIDILADGGEMDPDVARMYGAAAEVGDRLRTAAARLKAEAGGDATLALQTVATILRNAMMHPHEVKYRRVRKTNAAFHQRAGKFQAAIDMLNAAGFQQGSPGDMPDHLDYLVLKRDDPGLLWLACSTVEAYMSQTALSLP